MRAVVRLMWIEIKLLLRDPLTVVFSLALPLIVLFVLGGVFGNTPSQPGEELVYRGVGPMSYYVPAYIALVIASVCVISLPTHIAGLRERGVLKRYRASSVTVWTIAGAELLMALALSVVSAAVLLVAAALAFDFDAPASVPGVVAVFCCIAVGFAGLGLLLGAILPTARSAQALGMVLWFVMLFLGGAGPPPEVLTGAMRAVSDMTPLWPAVQMMQDVWLGLDAGLSWLVFSLVSLVSAVASLTLFRWE